MDDFFEIEEAEEVDEIAMVRLPRRVIRDRLNPLTAFSNEEFIQRYRLGKHSAQLLLDRIRQHIPRVANRKGNRIPPELQVFTCLRYLASGSFQMNVGDCSDISQPSVSRCVSNVCRAIANLAQEWIKFPTPEEEVNTSRQFASVAGMPGVIGCVDGTHVPVISPGGNIAEMYRCRKGFYSLNVMATCDPSLKFINMVTSSPGSVHDARVFENSQMCHTLEQGRYKGYLLGDSGYPCRRYLLTPIPTPNTESERRFNASHVRTRNLIERTFGIFKRRFAVLSIPVRTALQTTKLLIMACAVLHNIAVEYRVPLPELPELAIPQVQRQGAEAPANNNLHDERRGITFRRNVIETCF